MNRENLWSRPPIVVLGELGALPRREGLYSSPRATWRRQSRQGAFKALGRRRGQRPSKTGADQEIIRLRKENRRLKAELRKAHRIMEAQKKYQPCFLHPKIRVRSRRIDESDPGTGRARQQGPSLQGP